MLTSSTYDLQILVRSVFDVDLLYLSFSVRSKMADLEGGEAADEGGDGGEAGIPSGPKQIGRGVKGQYVYWIVMSHPGDEAVERLGLKVPSEFSREEFSQLVVQAHAEVNVEIVETACFYETHSSGLRHHNCLVRGKAQFKWLRAATRLRSEHNVCVSHGANIKTWAEGVVYGRVASEHKGPEMFNHGYTQWAANGSPAQLEEFTPRSWQAHGFVMLGVCMCMRPPRRHARASRNASTPARDCAAPCTR